MHKKYKHIFFDLDNTLWDFDANSYEALKETFLFYQLDRKIENFEHFHKIYSGHNERLWEEYRNNGLTKNELIRQRFQLTFEEFSLKDIDPVEFNTVFLGIMPNQKVLIPGAKDVLDYLKGRHYLLYIITNGFREVQLKKLGLSGIGHYFRNIFISEDIKSQKPSVEIFEYALKSSNARKKESLMVGDSWDVDVAGAAKAGIDQVFFNRNSKKTASVSQEFSAKYWNKTTTYTITNLMQILSFL